MPHADSPVGSNAPMCLPISILIGLKRQRPSLSSPFNLATTSLLGKDVVLMLAWLSLVGFKGRAKIKKIKGFFDELRFLVVV